MTPFRLADKLAKTRLHTRMREAVKLVLCDGLSQSEAARKVGVSRMAVHNALKVIERLKR